MHFSSSINRPPYEAQSGYLQITSGCSHNDCAFCNFYKDARFRVSPVREIEADLQELADTGIPFRRLFLQGADPFIMSYNKLMNVAEMVNKYLPSVKTIGGYARADNLTNKSVEELRKLYKAGFSNFYFGIESGDDALLARMNKGYTADTILRQMSKLPEAGMPWVSSFITGLGGHNYGLSHARETARVLNETHPAMVYGSGLTLFPDTPLWQDLETGKYKEATELERLIDLQEFIRNLTTQTIIRFEHVSVSVPVIGMAPQESERMINELQTYIDQGESREAQLRQYRQNVISL